LSYTTFGYSNLAVSGGVGDYTPPTGPGSSTSARYVSRSLCAEYVSDRTRYSLHAQAFTITVTLVNSGAVAGTEIPQLYLAFPASAGEPPYVLRGFEAVPLTAGQSKSVSFSLTRYDISIWSTVNQRWEIPSGQFGVAVGASSRDRRVTGSFTV
jgi:beta-glucosidase